MNPSIQILPFDVKTASLADFSDLTQLGNHMRRERLPDDPPIPAEEMIQELKNFPPYLDLRMWCAWDTSKREMVASGDVVLVHLDENKHMAQFEIAVRADHRRQGLGRKLLALLAGAAQADQRSLLITETSSRVPGGTAFMERIGGQKGLEGHVNQLRLVDLDRGLLATWLDQGSQLTAEFELGVWEGPYPEEQLAAVAQLFELTNQQPLGDLDIEEMHMTPERLRQSEKGLFARGSQRWTFYVLEKATRRFAGYSETVWNPNRPEILRQDMTGVFPEYRNKGLGRWLKAAMLAKILEERPQVKFVRTQNADSNAAMLKINTQLGFQPYMSTALWQVELTRISDYLGASH